MATVYIPETEATRDLPGLLARVRAGEEIVIEKAASPAVVLRVALTPVDLVEFDFGRLAELFTALPLLDLARVLLAVLRRAAARSVL